MPTYIQGGMDI